MVGNRAIQRLAREGNLAAVGRPASGQRLLLRVPRALEDGEWTALVKPRVNPKLHPRSAFLVTGERDGAYNCFAYSIGQTSQPYLDVGEKLPVVLRKYRRKGYVPIAPGEDGEIDLWGGEDPFGLYAEDIVVHASRRAEDHPLIQPGHFESKLGAEIRIAHPRTAFDTGKKLEQGLGLLNIAGYGRILASLTRRHSAGCCSIS